MAHWAIENAIHIERWIVFESCLFRQMEGLDASRKPRVAKHREKGEKEPSIYIHRVMALDRLNHRESIRISRCCYSQSRLASKCDVRLEALQDPGLSAR